LDKLIWNNNKKCWRGRSGRVFGRGYDDGNNDSSGAGRNEIYLILTIVDIIMEIASSRGGSKYPRDD